jgi:hypothetical protein
VLRFIEDAPSVATALVSAHVSNSPRGERPFGDVLGVDRAALLGSREAYDRDPAVAVGLVVSKFGRMTGLSGDGICFQPVGSAGHVSSVDLFDLDKDDFIEQVQDVITVGEF